MPVITQGVDERVPPLAAAVAQTCLRDGVDLNRLGDAELYRLIVHVNLTVMPEPARQPPRAILRLLSQLSARLANGWFAATVISPQSRFGALSVPSNIATSFIGGADKPAGAVWTSSFLPDGSSAWAPVEEISGMGQPRHVIAVDVEIRPERVARIDSWTDYVRLTERYPCADEPEWALVDWQELAAHYDGVHLTARGLVATHGREETLPDGRLVGLRGWDAECSAWFVDLLEARSGRGDGLFGSVHG